MGVKHKNLSEDKKNYLIIEKNVVKYGKVNALQIKTH